LVCVIAATIYGAIIGVVYTTPVTR
jgi:hypothetical protein